MAYLVVDKKERELIFESEPSYDKMLDFWYIINENIFYGHYVDDSGFSGGIETGRIYKPYINTGLYLPPGSIEKLIGRKMSPLEKPIKIN